MEDTKNQKVKKEIDISDYENVNTYYANTAHIEASVFDIKILFGVRSGDEGCIKNVNTQIIMSPQHAKALLLSLEGAVKSYEKTFGEIHLAPMNNASE